MFMSRDYFLRKKDGRRPIYNMCDNAKITNIQDRPPTERELVEVSKHIGAGFELVGAYLGINSIKMQHIIMNNGFSAETQIFKMLVTWKQKEGRQATVRKLLEAVKNSPGNVNVEEIEKIFNL